MVWFKYRLWLSKKISKLTISEKIQCSADKTIFTLIREGLFTPLDSGLLILTLFLTGLSYGVNKCYNEDAMVFVKQY
jgi:hypothetical protein